MKHKDAIVKHEFNGAEIHYGPETLRLYLRDLLRAAQTEHHKFEQTAGEPDPDWAAWYANFIVERL